MLQTSSVKEYSITFNTDNHQTTYLSSEASKGHDKLEKKKDYFNSTENWESSQKTHRSSDQPELGLKSHLGIFKINFFLQNIKTIGTSPSHLYQSHRRSKKIWTTCSGGKWTVASENVKCVYDISYIILYILRMMYHINTFSYSRCWCQRWYFPRSFFCRRNIPLITTLPGFHISHDPSCC